MDRVRRLTIDGEPSDLRVGVALRWWSRARGLWPGVPWPALDILQLPGCNAVHTFGMRVTLDVVFSDAKGRVTSVRHGLRPWRVARDADATCTWEMRAGMARRLGLRRGISLRAIALSSGATAVEFLLASMLVVIPAVFAVLEIAQLASARHLLRHAVSEAARQAEVAELSEPALRRSLGYGLSPLFVPLDPRDAFARSAGSRAGERLTADRGFQALARAYAETFRPDVMSVDLEPLDAAGRTLRLRVRYCRELYFPLVREFIPVVLRAGTVSLFDQACLARQRMPLEAWSLVLRRDEDVRSAGEIPVSPSIDPGLPPVLPPQPGAPGGGRGGGGDDRPEGDPLAR